MHRIRDEIDERVQKLIGELLPETTAEPLTPARRGTRPLARSLTAEFVGTFALVFAGCGAAVISVDAKTGGRSATSASRSASVW